jgi:hypothetical protein
VAIDSAKAIESSSEDFRRLFDLAG